MSSRKKFFIPVKVLSRKFRGKFLYLLKKAYVDGKLSFFGSQSYLENQYRFNQLLTTHYRKDWVVYCKPPFKNAHSVVEYLGRYTHRVAISNSRIVSMENCNVSFKWRDYKDENKWKVMTLSVDEFIRRFLIHVLPRGFMKIRHYGLLGNRNRKTKLLVCKKLTGTTIRSSEKLTTAALILEITGKDVTKCPFCGSTNLHRKDFQRAPPSISEIA